MAADWYARWTRDKEAFAHAPSCFVDKDRFQSITVGTGLPAIEQKSTFAFHSPEEGAHRFVGQSYDGEAPFARIYSRLGNPTTEFLENLLIRLEGDHIIEAARGAGREEPVLGAMAFASGMGAISMTLLSLVDKDTEVLCGDVVYSSTIGFLKSLGAKFGLRYHFVDSTDMEAMRATLEANPRIGVVFLETPDNPTLKISDIRAVADLAKERNIPLVVDNTFASPYLQQPLRLGADIVVHSMTKYINGRSTAVGGAVIGPCEYVRTVLFPVAKDVGANPSPFESWLNATNVQTLGHRVEHHCRSALHLARVLDEHPRITSSLYPGLPSHPHHEVCKKQMSAGGGMITFEVEGGLEPAKKLMQYFARPDTPMELAVSLGCVISYIQHPASMTHASVPREQRLASGLTDELVRLSVGLEGVSVLEAALREGLDQAYR